MREEIKPKVKYPLSKEEYEKVKKEFLGEKTEEPKEKPKTFNSFFKFGKRATMNKSLKKPDQILVFLLNLKKQIEGPILTKIYGGNFLVVRNHVYRFNPDRVFSFAKYKAVIAKEYDRELVGVDDYQELVLKDYTSKNPGARINIDDPVLIKALIQARLGEKTPVSNSKMIVIILIIVGIAVGAYLLFGGSGKKSATPTLVNQPAEPVTAPTTPTVTAPTTP